MPPAPPTPLAQSDIERHVNGSDHPAAPKLKFSTNRLDLGEGKPNEIVRGELILTNPGDSPVQFSLIRHCGCTELSPLSGTLPGFGKETIQVGVKLPDHSNSERGTRIEVTTVNPPIILAGCVIFARCPAPFRVTPSFINFGSVAHGAVHTSPREIRLESSEDRQPLDTEQILIEQTSDAFVIERRVPSVRSLAMRVSLKRGLPPGDYHDVLSLRRAESDEVMRVSLHASVVEPISVVPATVVLRKDPKTRAFPTAKLLVLSRSGYEAPGSVVLADGPPGVHIDDLGIAGEDRRRILVSVDEKADCWPKETQIWLRSGKSERRFGFTFIKSR